jgi:predicted RND superfamily exporter protein
MDGDSMTPQELGVLGRTLAAVTHALAHRPRFTIFLVIVSCVFSLGWTAGFLKFKTDRSDLIDPTTAFHQRWIRYTDKFGSTPDIVVAAEGQNGQAIRDALDELGPALEAEPALFTRVQWKTETAGLRAKGLQFLPPPLLEAGLAQLEEFAPILDGRWERAKLENYADSLAFHLDESTRKKDSARHQAVLTRAARLSESLSGFLQNPAGFLSPWPEAIPSSARGAMSAGEAPQYQLNEQETMGFLLVTPASTAEDFAGASASIKRLREIVAEKNLENPEIRLGLTGIPVLEADEMERSQKDMSLASILSSVIVLAIMLWGFGGYRHPLISMLMLGVGVCWSLWFATVTVGHLNILSMSFASILIGLGVDYAIHYLEHYLELRHAGLDLIPALSRTAGSVGSGILTCSIATAMSFFCAALTSFQGVKELGIIAGGGVLLCVVAAFVSLPAMVVIADKNVEPGRLPRPFSGRGLQTIIARFPWIVGGLCCIMIFGGGAMGFRIVDSKVTSKVEYDSNLLNMQAQEVDSVKLQQRIFEQSKGSLLYAVSIAPNAAEARRLKDEFLKLPSVGRVIELASAMPSASPDVNGPLVEKFHSRLANVPEAPPEVSELNPPAIIGSLGKLAAALGRSPEPAAMQAAARIHGFLKAAQMAPPQQIGQLLGGYQQALYMALHGQFRALLAVSNPEPVSAKDLPEALRSRYVSPQGDWALHVYPAQQVWEEAPLTEFVHQVRSVDPEITGTPLQNYEAAIQIRDSYYDSAVYAFAMIVLVLLVDFLPGTTLIVSLLAPLIVVGFAVFTGASQGIQVQPKVLVAIYALVSFAIAAIFDASSVFKTFCALLPPVAGGFMMFGLMGLWGMNLNPANMIVLPLLLGMGVDAGIYIVHDYREQTTNKGLAGVYRVSTCTINSILMISTTTIVGFGCMVISAHRGIVSLGLTLTIGVTCSMIVSLLALPSLLTVLDRWNARRQRAGAAAASEELAPPGSPASMAA